MTTQTRPTTNPHDQHHDRNDNDLLTIDEAAATLRTPVATLRYWRHLGAGPHSFKIGRRVFYRTSDLNTWLNAQHDNHGTNRSLIADVYLVTRQS
jgi:hypothetical protein